MNTPQELIEGQVRLARHGQKIITDDPVLKEQISPESLERLHTIGKAYFGKFTNPDKIALFVSQRPRTEASGRAFLAGALGLKTVPKSQWGILNPSNYPVLDTIDTNRRYGLGFYTGDLNEKVYAEGEKERATLGGQRCVEFGLPNLDSQNHEGEKVRPFGHMVGKVGGVLEEAIGLITSGRKDLVELSSHAINADAGAALLVSSFHGVDKSNLVKTAAEYGGPFAEEDYGVLKLGFRPKQGSFAYASFDRNGTSYLVDMTNFLNLASQFRQDYPSSKFA